MINMKRTRELALVSILTALTVVLGRFVSIATPTGFLTLLDAGVYVTAFSLGKKEGMLVGGLSAFLLDLISGYPNWMLISLVAHGAQGYLAGLSGRYRFFGVGLASVVMVGLYFLAAIPMYGMGAAISEISGNAAQNILGIGVGYLLYLGVKKQLVKVSDD